MKKYVSIVLAFVTIAAAYIFLKEEKKTEKPFVIVTTSYNNKDYYKKNLDSIFSQKYQNYRLIYVDDLSPDGTGLLVEEYVKGKGKEKQVTLIKNTERAGALSNIYTALSQCKNHEIIVSVDGDDWLSHDHVLTYLNEVYSDPSVWLTYGQFICYPDNSKGFAVELPKEVIEKNDFRSFGGATHLRTFYAGLFHRIKKEDLLHQNKFYSMAWDSAMLIPMLEMSGKHTKFISEVLYVYNRETPINDEKLNRGLQHSLDKQIRSKEKYAPIANYK